MEGTRQKILTAALEAFSSQGYAGATTRGIAISAGVTEVTLFRHFPTKEKLFEDVVCSFLPNPDFARIVTRARELEYQDALHLIALGFINGLKQHENLIRVVYMECQRHNDLLEQVYTELVSNITLLISDYLKELQAKNVVKEFNTEISSRMFLGTFFGFFEDEFLLKMGNSGANFEEIISTCVEIFARGTRV